MPRLDRRWSSWRKTVVTLGLVVAVGLAIAGPAAVVGGRAAASPTSLSSAGASTASCTAAEKAQRLAALKNYAAAAATARRAYFRSHPSPRARSAFVRRQQAKLRALRRAAACTVIPAGSRIVATIPIPTDGPAIVAANAVWVVDREGETANADDTPNGSIFRVDATTNAVTDQIKGVAGGQATFGFGSIWLAAFAFNAVFRVDTTTRHVSRLPSGPSDDEGPAGVATTATSVWVANHHGGTVAQFDPGTGEVVRSVQLVAPGPGGPQNMVADGAELWVELAGANAVAQIDTTTATILRQTTVSGGACGGIASDPAHIWVASGQCGRQLVSAIDRQTNQVSELTIRGTPNDVAIAFGSVWVTTNSPPRLVRVDPATRTVVGSLELPAAPWNIAVGADALWVRVDGSLLRVVPQS
jgi:streptogramin lyase